MFKNYIKTAWRNLSKNPAFTLVNTIGLAVGIGTCLLIYRYVDFEQSFDNFHVNKENIYRISLEDFKNDISYNSEIYTGYGLKEFEENIPEIKDFVRISIQNEGFVLNNTERNEPFQEDGIWYADPNFFSIFDFPLIAGSMETALNGKRNIVITEAMALKYFGDIDALGKTLKVSGGWASGDYTVSGILKDLPRNSHMQFDFLFPISLLFENSQYQEDTGWDWRNFVSYILLEKNASIAEIQHKLDEIISSNVNQNDTSIATKASLQNLNDIHFNAFPDDITQSRGNKSQIKYFIIISIFILLIAYINYINLSIVRSLNRAKEVGIRKTIGASKKQLVFQFMSESFLVNLLAAFVAILVAFLLLPIFNHELNISLDLQVLNSLQFWCLFLILLIVGTVLSSFYPAIILSSYNPAKTLKSGALEVRKTFDLRKGLIVFQLAISLLLISASWLIFKQIDFMQNQSTGINMEKILVVNGPRVIIDSEKSVMESRYERFKNQLVNQHTIKSVSGAGRVPGRGFDWMGSVRKADESISSEREMTAVYVDSSFFNTYDFEFLAGRGFTPGKTDLDEIVLNEETVKHLGFSSAEEAVGEELLVGDDYRLIIAGVTQNFKWSSLKQTSKPIMFIREELYNAYFAIRLDLSDVRASIQHIETNYKSAFPEDPFYYYFLDEDFNNQYQSDLRFMKVFTAFACLAIFIACMGLFSLVSYTATLRTKEIGIRKTLGAQVHEMMYLLSKGYLILFIIANVVAIPVFILLANEWLDNYASRISLSISLVLIPSFFMLLIALITISIRTYKTANMNPVNSLKSE